MCIDQPFCKYGQVFFLPLKFRFRFYAGFHLKSVDNFICYNKMTKRYFPHNIEALMVTKGPDIKIFDPNLCNLNIL